MIPLFFLHYRISTHTLTWSVTQSDYLWLEDNDFNSHAHVERDVNAASVPDIAEDFNSHAHVERDLCGHILPPPLKGFQLTRSRGA